ncbi:AP-3 adaptor complex subunit beta, putative [Penicillium digitatum PHI26]|uniref:AP-3 adaptor complex subunit beta, putative n=2 Tax=Penicillium digitatum TaxID=36651 RepID=K9GQV7_PEND2|nr:AP-3 adaptor complex subunit beta, putative [Penicillium digitatum Pd1]EKV10334.1 AP-3 adaptor complex subunit beta, putative [Penicillium digitatum Pd1]EKV15481.1 AP-3 adaptor complex subunit beta, putative [Penicillium digitatum PHI26]
MQMLQIEGGRRDAASPTSLPRSCSAFPPLTSHPFPSTCPKLLDWALRNWKDGNHFQDILDAGNSTDFNSRAYSPALIKKLLDSRHEREVLDGMRRVISLMYRSEPSLTFFSAVVKNVASANLEVKKLVYIYLVHHAETEPDLALLSINAIQKSLTDSSPQVRTMALRTMSGIRVPVISQIVSLAIKRGCGDMSPHVRKAAALAIPKCYRLDPNTLPQLMGYLETLLGDSQYFVVGPAVAAFLDLCPDEIDLIHKNYRSLVKKLVDMDEWGQLATLRLLTFYARRCFPQRTQKVKRAAPEAFYDDEKQQQETQNDAQEYEVPVLDPDLELLLRACKVLLQSRNSAVIVSVARCFLYLAPSEYIASAVGPLVALLRTPQDMQIIALYNIVAVALRVPKPFAKYTAHFLIHANDPPHIWRLKLEVLTILFPHCGKHWKGVIISELEHFSKGADPELVRECVRAIGRCAQGDTSATSMCLRILLDQISSPDGNLVSESLTVIRHLIQQDPSSHKNTVLQLVKHLGSTTHPDARATIIWLVGEFAGIEPENNIAPDVLRILIKGFADEKEIVKQQTVLLGAKVYLHHLLQNPPKEQPEQLASQPFLEAPAQAQQKFHNEWTDNGNDEPQDAGRNDEGKESRQENDGAETRETEEATEDRITLLWRYLLLLARYDTSYDLRDRARLYKSLLETPSSTQLANLLLLAPKPVPHAPSPSETRKDLLIGSATLVVGPDAGYHGLRGYTNLPDWVEPGHEPDPSLRTEDVKPDTSNNTTTTTMTAGDRLDKALREHKTTSVPSRARNGPATSLDPAGKKTLDQWLQEETETESETDSEEGETDSEEEETDSEEESGSEEESDSDEETDSETEAVHKEAQQLLR